MAFVHHPIVRPWHLILTSGVLAALGGCADPPRRPARPKPERPPERAPDRDPRGVTLKLWDSGHEADDAFRLEVDDAEWGQTPVGGERRWELRLTPGEHVVRVRGVGAPDGQGTYILELGGPVRVIEGPKLTGQGLNQGVLFTWRVVVD
jgi:hypothetical protein